MQVYNQHQFVDQNGLMQALSNYFSAPSSKPLPFAELFKKNIDMIIKYLYPFFKTKYNKIVLVQHLQMLIERIEQLLQQIILSVQQDKKMLIGRYIGIGASIANFRAGSIELSKHITQKQLIKHVLNHIKQFEPQLQTFILNKVLLLNQQQCLGQKIIVLIVDLFDQLSKQHKIIIYLLKQKKSCILKTLLSKYQQIIHPILWTVLNSKQFSQNDSQQVVQMLVVNESIQQKLLQNLLIWWARSNDELDISQSVRFKTNVTYLILSKYTKKDILESGYTVYLSQGIQKRFLKNGYMRDAAILIWVKMAKILEMQDNVKEYLTFDKLFKTEKQQIKALASQKKQNIQNELKQEHDKSTIQQHNNQNLQVPPQDQQNIYIKAPRNIYDCILALRNPHRRKLAIKYLPSIMLKYPDDLTISWRNLCETLIAPFHDDNQQPLVVLFTLKPIEVIQLLSDRFFKSDCSLHQRIILLRVVQRSIEELSSNPAKYSRQIQEENQDFYFKKVQSKYFNDRIHEIEHSQKQKKVRRWGHTRIAHEKKSSIPSLLIFNNDPYINRLYQIVNCVFFKMIAKLHNSSVLLKNEEFTRCLLNLLSTFAENIKNHIQKYSIIVQQLILLKTVLQIYDKKQSNNVMACIQLLLKITLTIDKFITDHTLLLLKQCLDLLKHRQQYGIRVFIENIEENIFMNMKLKLGM